MTQNEIRGGPPPSDPIAALLRSAGPRATPDAQRMEAARANVHAAWHEAVLERRRERWHWLAASLAAVAVGVLALLAWMGGRAESVATVSRIAGDVRVHRESAPEVGVHVGETLNVGDQVETGSAGRVLLSWPDGIELRMDRESLVQIDAPTEAQLLRGTVYVDVSRSAPSADRFAVSTRFGEVRHVGTRFEVHVADDHVRVRVRDGKAAFSGHASASPTLIAAGQQLLAGSGALKLEPGPAIHDGAWSWTQQIAPVFELEGRSLSEALAWLSHESGLPVVYESEQLKQQAGQIILRGSIEGLDLRAAFHAVLSGSGLDFAVHPDRVDIRSPD
jgi:hypothetical protein